MTIKVVAYQPLNSLTAGFPTIVASASLYDFATGHLVALADGVFLTALRTGAASAVVSRILAHPDSTTVGLVGAGSAGRQPTARIEPGLPAPRGFGT